MTNEYAHWNSGAPDARTSPIWDMTSGSLFVRKGVGWSGRADRGPVDAASSKATNSAVFRLVTKDRTFGDVRYSLRFRLLRFTPVDAQADDWDGLHLWLRYQDETQLYAASVARRDHTVTFKRKDAGGDANGGTYTQLASTSAPVTAGAWHTAVVTVRNVDADGRPGVELALELDGARLLHAVDTSDKAIRAPGGLGVRADNLEFEFTDVRVESAS